MLIQVAGNPYDISILLLSIWRTVYPTEASCVPLCQKRIYFEGCSSGAVSDMWNQSPQLQQALKAWQTFATRSMSLRVHDKERSQVHDGQGMIPLAHGSFDNDVEV